MIRTAARQGAVVAPWATLVRVGWRVRAPDGTTWTVRRRWLPLRGLAVRRPGGLVPSADGPAQRVDAFDGPLGTASGRPGAVVVVVAVAVAIALLSAGVPVAIVAAGGACAVFAPALIGRPWWIEATSDRGERHRVRIRGWRASHDEGALTVDRLAAGLPIPGAAPHLAPRAPGAERRPSPHGAEGQPVDVAGVAGDADGPAPSRARAATWASVGMLVVSMVLLAVVRLGPRWFWDGDCRAPRILAGVVTAPALPATLVAAGPLSVDDAVLGKYGTDGRRSAIGAGTLLAAHHEDWQTGADVTLLRTLTFQTQRHALDYAAVDAETICAFVDSTFTPDGVPEAAGVRQPWRSGPPGWWAGVVVDRTYVRAYVRSHAEDRGHTMVTDALKRAILDLT